MSEELNTLEKGLNIVTMGRNDLNLSKLKSKDIGLQILMLGLAESAANSVHRLSEAKVKLEKILFDVDVLTSLTDDQKIERYSLALNSISQSANFIKSTTNSIDWNTVEVQLLKMASSGSGEEEFNDISREDLSDKASELLKELSKSN